MSTEIDRAVEKMILGKRWKDIYHVPSGQSITNKLAQSLLTSRPLRTLGWGDDAEVTISEEDNSHWQILGSTQEGKSKLQELLCRQNIDNDLGGLLIDPSDNGSTAYKVLKYAITKGYNKFILIDPHDFRRFDSVPTINPIHYKEPAPAVVGNLMDAFRVLWGTKDFSDTPRIQKYLPSILTALHADGRTLAEARYFMGKKAYANRRIRILDALDDYDIHRVNIEEAFYNPREYDMYQSTINRLMPLMDPTIEMMFGSNDTPMDFEQMVKEKYFIAVVADEEGIFAKEHQRLMCTLIINEITYAVSRLRNYGWQGVYHLFIDEAGDYATGKLAYILDKKAKSGIRLCLSHQRFDQFADRDVSSSVYANCKIKVLFNTASRDDRDKMIRMMYGGELTDREVSYNLMSTRKQECVIKIGKKPPVSMRVPDVPDVEIKTEVLEDFKRQLYNSYPFYRSVKSIRDEIDNRFVTTTRQFSRSDNIGRPERRPAASTPGKKPQDDHKTVKQAITSEQGTPKRAGAFAKRAAQISPDLRTDSPGLTKAPQKKPRNKA